MKVYENNCTALYCIGDTHGYYNVYPYMIKSHDLKDATIVCCGDIGIGWEKSEHYKTLFKRVNKLCKERNVHIYMVRGNHDDPLYYRNSVIDYSNVHTVPDYSVIKMPDHNILCIGGATSVDRVYRKQQMERSARDYMRWHHGVDFDTALGIASKGYWYDEGVVFSEEDFMELKESGILIDTVCTHTAPVFCAPTQKGNIQGFLAMDPPLAEDLDNERKVMSDIYDRIISDGHPLKNWVYGHFHFHNMEYIDGVKFLLLDEVHAGQNFDIADIR